MDLVPPQRVRRRQRRRVEGRDDEFVVGLVVGHTSADEPLVRGGEDTVVHGLLEGEGLGLVGRETAHAVIDRQAQPVALGGIGQVQIPDGLRQIVRIALLEAQSINLEITCQIDQLAAGRVLAEVVADDSKQGEHLFGE